MVGSRTTAVTRRVTVPAGIRAGARVGWARKGATAALGVLVGVVFAGCQSNPEPPPVDAAEFSASPSPTASPTPEPPTLPAEAEKKTRAGAKAFVRHYIRLVNYAMATGETDALSAAGDSDCKSCAGVIERIRKVYDDGGHIQSNGWRVTVISTVPGQPKKSPLFDVGLKMSPQRVLMTSGGDARSFQGGKLPATFLLKRSGGQWLVDDWERAA